MFSRPITWRVWAVITRRPALGALVFFVAGLLLAGTVPPHRWAWLVAVLCLILAAFCLRRITWICSVFLAGAIALAGIAMAQLDGEFFPADQIALFTDPAPQLTGIEFRLEDTPHFSGGAAENRVLPLKQIATARLAAIQTRQGWEPAAGKVFLTIDQPVPGLVQGQTLRALAFLSRLAPPANPGEFDFAAHERRRGILAEARIRRSQTIQIMASPHGPVAWLRARSRRLLAAGFDDHGVDAAFVQMLLLGDPDPRLNDVRQNFTLTGAGYLLSVSGLHIAILTGALLLLLRLAGLGPKKSLLACIAFVGLYAAVVNSAPTGWRALAMTFAAAAGLLGRRSLDGLQIWAIALLIILVAAPSDLYDTGFQIGAVSVLALIVLAGPVGGFLFALTAPRDPWPRPRAAGIAAIAIQAIARGARQTLLISAVIWAAILPIVAIYFQQINPWAIPIGVVMLPVLGIALLGAAGKILLTLICPPLSTTWAMAAAVPIHWLADLAGLFSRLPGAALTTAAPPVGVIALYYALLLLPLIPRPVGRLRWILRLCPVLGCLLVLFSPVPADAFSPPAQDAVRVTLLSVGAGQTALVRVSGGQTFFIDCGSDTVSDVYRKIIHPYLLYTGVRRIDEIFLSHGDYDHICAAWEITRDYVVPTVRLTPEFRVHASGGPLSAAPSLLHNLDTLGPHPTLTSFPARLDLGGGATLQVLWPPPDCKLDSNDCGMVLKLNYGSHSILFPADIQVAPEDQLLKHPADLKADVLIAPHHGSAESSTLGFIRAVNPRMILCSSSHPLTHKQENFDRLAAPWPTYRTDACGAIDLTLFRDGRIDVHGHQATTREP